MMSYNIFALTSSPDSAFDKEIWNKKNFYISSMDERIQFCSSTYYSLNYWTNRLLEDSTPEVEKLVESLEEFWKRNNEVMYNVECEIFRLLTRYVNLKNYTKLPNMVKQNKICNRFRTYSLYLANKWVKKIEPLYLYETLTNKYHVFNKLTNFNSSKKFDYNLLPVEKCAKAYKFDQKLELDEENSIKKYYIKKNKIESKYKLKETDIRFELIPEPNNIDYFVENQGPTYIRSIILLERLHSIIQVYKDVRSSTFSLIKIIIQDRARKPLFKISTLELMIYYGVSSLTHKILSETAASVYGYSAVSLLYMLNSMFKSKENYNRMMQYFEEYTEIQGPLKEIYYGIQQNPFCEYLHERAENIIKAIAEGGVASREIKSSIGPAVKEVKEDVLKQVESLVSVMEQKILSFNPDYNTSLTRNIIFNIGHFVINPTIKTLAWVVISFFCEIGLATIQSIGQWMTSLHQFIKSLRLSFGNESQEPNGAVQAQAEGEETQFRAAQGFIALLWTSVCGIAGAVKRKPKDFTSWIEILTRDLKEGMNSANVLFRFLSNINSVLDDMLITIFGYVSPKYASYTELETSSKLILEWQKEVIFLTSPHNIRQVEVDTILQDRVFSAVAKGGVLISKTNSSEKIFAPLYKMYSDVKQLADNLLAMGNSPHVRKLPYTIWLCGPSNIGKSYVSQHLCSKLLKSQNITYSGSMICNVNPMSSFWDQCQHQPVLMIDDFFAVRMNQYEGDQVAILFQVVSPVPLTPPMADLKDKKLRYNPEIFFISSNKIRVQPQNCDITAVNRRRDVVIYAELKKINDTNKKENCAHCEGKALNMVSPEHLSDYHHLTFWLTKEVVEVEDSDWIKKKGVKFEDFSSLMQYLEEDFAINRDLETQKFEQRVNEQILAAEPDDDLELSLEERCRLVQQKQYDELQRIHESNVYSYVKQLSIKCTNWSKDRFKNLLPSVTAEAEMNVQPIQLFNYQLLDIHIKNFKEFSKLSICSTPLYKSPLISTLLSPSQARIFKILLTYSSASVKREHDQYVQLLERHIDGVHAVMQRYPHTARTLARMHLALLDVAQDDVDIIACKHMDLDLLTTYVSNDGFVYDECEKIECIHDFCNFKSPLFSYIFWNRWLRADSNRMRAYLKGDFTALPPSICSVREFLLDETVFKAKLKQLKSDIINGFNNGLSKLWYLIKVFGEVICLLAPFFAVGLLGICAYRLATDPPVTTVNRIYTNSPTWSYCEGAYSGLKNPVKVVKPAIAAKANLQSQQSEVAIKRVQENMFTITAVHNGMITQASGVILKGRTLLMLRHFLNAFNLLKDSAVFYGKFNYGTIDKTHPYGVQFDYNSLIWRFYGQPLKYNCYSSNYVVAELGREFSERKSLLTFMAKTTDHSSVNGYATIVSNSGKNLIRVAARRTQQHHDVCDQNIDETVKLTDMYMYHDVHGFGMCGSILVADNLTRPIIGIHVAGVSTSNYGLSEVLNQETFSEVVEQKEADYKELVIPQLNDANLSRLDLENLLYPLGSVDPKHAVSQNGSSSYVPSHIHGVFEVKTIPAPLCKKHPLLPKDAKSPLSAGIDNMGKPPLSFKKCDLILAYEDLNTVILNNVRPMRGNVGVVNIDVAIVGDPNLAFYEPLEWNSSEGYPLVKSRPAYATNKRWLFNLQETQEGYRLIDLHPKLKNLLSFDQSLREQGIKPFTIFTDCLKDTTMPIEKCKIPGKTRVFSISPVQFTIAFKQYFLDFMAGYQASRFAAEHAIGINCESREWHELYRWLSRTGTQYVTGDYKNFGPGLMLEAARVAFQIILNWYELHGATQIEQQVRKVMINEVLEAPHLVLDLIYKAPAGIPSGSPITTPLNSLVNSLYLRIGWKYLTNLSYETMHDHVTIVTYGDDVIMGVSEVIKDIYNTETLSNFFLTYNIVFTDQDKTGSIVKYRDIETCQFLKRSFKFNEQYQIFVGALDKISVEGCANWIHKKGNSILNTEQVAEQSCMLAVEHGEQYYNYVRNQIQLCCQKVNLKPRLYSYRYWMEERYSVVKAKAEMAEKSKEGDQVLKNDSAGNVTLTEARQEAIASASVVPPNPNLTNYVTSDDVIDYTQITDRWLRVKDFTWTSDHTENSVICSMRLPREIITTEETTACKISNLIPFTIHRYWRGNMQIKIQINANKFQMGQLMCSWWYLPHLDDKFDYVRLDLGTASTTTMCLISAAQSNEAMIDVPFKHYNPFISTKTRSSYKQPLYLGELQIRVLNPLAVPEGNTKDCSGTIFVKFYDSQFTGMIAGSIDPIKAEAEMNVENLIGLAANMLLDPNRDNPPRTSAPHMLVPQASNSWSIGTGDAEPVHNLRLSAPAQTNHIESDINEMSISYVTSKFGYVNTFEWSEDHKVETKLKSFYAAPIMDLDMYRQIASKTHSLAAYYIPPVGVISSLFNYWRGNLLYKFHIISTQFHTGRLLLAYIPGVAPTASVTLAQARGSPHMVFTLQEQNEFVFEVPYISDKPFWPRSSSGNYPIDVQHSPSSVFIFVLNALKRPSSVVNKVYINMYQAGASTFEVAVPVQPSLGLSYERTYYTAARDILFSDQGQFYSGWAKTVLNEEYAVLRYGTGTNQLSTFSKTIYNKRTYYLVWNGTQYPQAYYGGKMIDIRYIFLGSTDLGVLGYPAHPDLQNSASAAQVARLQYEVYLKNSIDSIKEHLFPTKDGTTANPWIDDAGWQLKVITSRAVAEGEREEIGFTTDTQRNRLVTGASGILFGEKFQDLKDLVRRYQSYCSMFLKWDKAPAIYGACSIILPLLPQGLRLNIGTQDHIMEMSNRCRDGHIPIIASGYRFFRGSMRLRLLFSNRHPMTIWVQHRPDRRIRSDLPIRCSEVETAESVLNHSYANYLQLTHVNAVVQLEIPYYLPGSYGLLQRPKIPNDLTELTDYMQYYGLGELAIGFLPSKDAGNELKSGVAVEIQYSMADDMRFYNFQGFPPMVSLNDIPASVPKVYSEDGFECIEAQAEMSHSHYENYTPHIARMELHSWYNIRDVVRVLKHMRNLNYSLQEHRSEALSLLQSLQGDVPFSNVNRFNVVHSFVSEDLADYRRKFMQLRLAVAYKDLSKDSAFKGERNNYNDSMVSYYNVIQSILQEIADGHFVYNREIFEAEFSLKWVD